MKDIHIYATPDCNVDCSYCFRDYYKGHSEDNLIKIAKILAKNDVEKVTIGGGEPTIVGNIVEVFNILKDADIYTEMHTNAMTLDSKTLHKFDPVLDSIAIPIDSLNQDIQKQMKGVDYVPIFKKVVKELENHDFDLEYHTVAAYPNIDTIPEIYDFIKETDFSAWSIYLFNYSLAKDSILQSGCSVKAYKRKRNNIEILDGPENYETGCTDGLFAKFLLLEEEMQKHNDDRMSFVGNFEHGKLYVFINSTGDVTASQNKIKAGNIIEEGFSGIMENLDGVKDIICEEAAGNILGSLPPFARLSDQAVIMHVEEEELPAFARLSETHVENGELNKMEKEELDLWDHLCELYVKKYPDGAPID